MLTFRKEYRNFSVVWKDEQSRFYSECYVEGRLIPGEA